jgi:hypothetical protein
MKRPESVTLSAQEGEAMMARLAAYAPSMSDCEVLIQVLRWHFSHSIGFSGGQLPSYVEGSAALDFPLIHDAQSQDHP